TSQALHIFEPRYRQMLADCQAGDGRFGISPVVAQPQHPPPRGSVGCTATVRNVVPLPDGRSNITVAGGTRYAVAGYVETDRQYLIAEVDEVNDDPWFDHDAVTQLAADVRDRFLGYLAALGQAQDDVAGAAPPDDPGGLSFAVSAALEVDLALKVRLLELRSTSARLELLRDLLGPLTESARQRALVHRQAKRNGRRRFAQPLDGAGS
ncbi:MAG: LON peptidase substrate-binding domain-containing protein, partial [Gemmatimonadales bacterium]|nr:LON peptidase substrate-binding domain-containing protein [Gemmatimonadales bacterium]